MQYCITLDPFTSKAYINMINCWKTCWTQSTKCLLYSDSM